MSFKNRLLLGTVAGVAMTFTVPSHANHRTESCTFKDKGNREVTIRVKNPGDFLKLSSGMLAVRPTYENGSSNVRVLETTVLPVVSEGKFQMCLPGPARNPPFGV